mmetsp:Transcript_92570/g.288591  ORF Transcript_92570/g.288591 Transcript_92570/m.288591 type:complete len:371 (+) Transcript_92570:983-2095(+)
MSDLCAEGEQDEYHNVAQHGDADGHLGSPRRPALQLGDHGDDARGAPGRHQGRHQQRHRSSRGERGLQGQRRHGEDAVAAQQQQAGSAEGQGGARDEQDLQRHRREQVQQLRHEDLRARGARDEGQRHAVDDVADEKDVEARDQVRAVRPDEDAHEEEAGNLREHAARELREVLAYCPRGARGDDKGDAGVAVVADDVDKAAGEDLLAPELVARGHLTSLPLEPQDEVVGTAYHEQGQLPGAGGVEGLSWPEVRAGGHALAEQGAQRPCRVEDRHAVLEAPAEEDCGLHGDVGGSEPSAGSPRHAAQNADRQRRVGVGWCRREGDLADLDALVWPTGSKLAGRVGAAGQERACQKQGPWSSQVPSPWPSV